MINIFNLPCHLPSNLDFSSTPPTLPDPSNSSSEICNTNHSTFEMWSLKHVRRNAMFRLAWWWKFYSNISMLRCKFPFCWYDRRNYLRNNEMMWDLDMDWVTWILRDLARRIKSAFNRFSKGVRWPPFLERDAGLRDSSALHKILYCGEFVFKLFIIPSIISFFKLAVFCFSFIDNNVLLQNVSTIWMNSFGFFFSRYLLYLPQSTLQEQVMMHLFLHSSFPFFLL